MTLSPITVYFILQADQIRSGTMAIFFVTAVISALRWAIPHLGWAGCFSNDEEKKWEAIIAKAPSLTVAILLASTGFACMGLFPSTNTLAASVIAPAIVNSTVIQTDIPELYSLGIGKLKEAMSPKNVEASN